MSFVHGNDPVSKNFGIDLYGGLIDFLNFYFLAFSGCCHVVHTTISIKGYNRLDDIT